MCHMKIEACMKLGEDPESHKCEKSEVTLDDRITSVLLMRILIMAEIYESFVEKVLITRKSIRNNV